MGGPATWRPRPDGQETLASLANEAAIAIENDRLASELRELAVRDERERIARELHDGLAQVLGYVSTKSQAVEEYLAADRVAEARGQLGELAAAARSLYVDVREAILGLRSEVTPGTGLASALRAYAPRFAEASKLAIHVESSDEAGSVRLDSDIEEEVFRIVRECLTNVRKHAAARRVLVRLSLDGDRLSVEVEDDGHGFDPGTLGRGDAAQGSLGIAGIRERAGAIGATVDWRARPDGGTIARVRVPLDEPAGVTP